MDDRLLEEQDEGRSNEGCLWLLSIMSISGIVVVAIGYYLFNLVMI